MGPEGSNLKISKQGYDTRNEDWYFKN